MFSPPAYVIHPRHGGTESHAEEMSVPATLFTATTTDTTELASHQVQQLKAEIVELKRDLYDLVYAKHIYSPHEDGDDSQ